MNIQGAQSAQPSTAYVRTLSLRLTAADYRRLRRFVLDQEEQSGCRLTHQTVLETALARFLDAEDADLSQRPIVTLTSAGQQRAAAD